MRIDNGSERGDRGGTVNISWGEKIETTREEEKVRDKTQTEGKGKNLLLCFKLVALAKKKEEEDNLRESIFDIWQDGIPLLAPPNHLTLINGVNLMGFLVKKLQRDNKIRKLLPELIREDLRAWLDWGIWMEDIKEVFTRVNREIVRHVYGRFWRGKGILSFSYPNRLSREN